MMMGFKRGLVRAILKSAMISDTRVKYMGFRQRGKERCNGSRGISFIVLRDGSKMEFLMERGRLIWIIRKIW